MPPVFLFYFLFEIGLNFVGASLELVILLSLPLEWLGLQIYASMPASIGHLYLFF
jgi:hypothetical protein